MPVTRPTGYARWATDGGATITEPNAGQMDSGWVNLQLADEGQFNWLLNMGYQWDRYLDSRTLGGELIGPYEWMQPSVGFTTGAGLSHSFAAGVLVIDGHRIELDSTWLTSNNYGGPYLLANGTTYEVGVSLEREVQVAPFGTLAGDMILIQTITTSGGNLTSVVDELGVAPSGGCIVGAPVRFSENVYFGETSGGSADVELWRTAGGLSSFLSFSIDGGDRMSWEFNNSANLLLRRHDGAGTVLDHPIVVANAAAQVGLYSSETGLGQANSSWRHVVLGALDRNPGLSFVLDDQARICFTHTSTSVDGFIGYTSAGDTMTFTAGVVSLSFDANGLIPADDGAYSLGADGNAWVELYSDGIRTFDIYTDGSSSLTLSGGDIVLLGTQADDDCVRIQTQQGAEGGTFNNDYLELRTKVIQTNTNGNEDLTLVPSSSLTANGLYKVHAEIMGVENTTAADHYTRRMLSFYVNTTAGAFSFSHTLEDTGVSGGHGAWAGTCSAGLVADSGALLLRVTAADTVVRNWKVDLTISRLTHSD